MLMQGSKAIEAAILSISQLTEGQESTNLEKKFPLSPTPKKKIKWRTSLLISLPRLDPVSNLQVIFFRLENRLYTMSLEISFPARCCLQNQE
jgi:hypothetical protein